MKSAGSPKKLLNFQNKVSLLTYRDIKHLNNFVVIILYVGIWTDLYIFICHAAQNKDDLRHPVQYNHINIKNLYIYIVAPCTVVAKQSLWRCVK